MMASLPRVKRKRIELRGEYFTVIKPEFIRVIALKMSLDNRDFKSALKWLYKYTDGFIANLNGVTQSDFDNYKTQAEALATEASTLSRNERKRQLKELLTEAI
jgi:hypothetical protein